MYAASDELRPQTLKAEENKKRKASSFPPLNSSKLN
jgi:hypothetical protein